MEPLTFESFMRHCEKRHAERFELGNLFILRPSGYYVEDLETYNRLFDFFVNEKKLGEEAVYHYVDFYYAYVKSSLSICIKGMIEGNPPRYEIFYNFYRRNRYKFYDEENPDCLSEFAYTLKTIKNKAERYLIERKSYGETHMDYSGESDPGRVPWGGNVWARIEGGEDKEWYSGVQI